MRAKTKRIVKSKKLKVISVCSICGEPVAATTKDKAYRHGFQRHKLVIGGVKNRRFFQEDGNPCDGSGETVAYRRRKAK